MIILSIVLAAILSFALNAVAVRGALVAPLDLPNERSLHARPVPRGGGVGIVCGLCAALLASDGLGLVVALAVGLAVLSLADDWRSLPALVRLAGHLAAAVVFCLVESSFPPAVMVFVILAVCWMTNLYNFMDGADGLAGGMAAIGFGTYAIAASLVGETDLAVACACIAAAAAAFLWFNFYPAKIFMGDVGSIPLGFLSAALGVLGLQRGVWPWWFPPVVFAPFVIDASVTLARRLVCGEKVWRAHRSHYYQRLVRMGWAHRQVAAAEYALMGACAAAALVAIGQSIEAQALLVALPLLLLAAAMFAIDRRWARSQQARS